LREALLGFVHPQRCAPVFDVETVSEQAAVVAMLVDWSLPESLVPLLARRGPTVVSTWGEWVHFAEEGRLPKTALVVSPRLASILEKVPGQGIELRRLSNYRDVLTQLAGIESPELEWMQQDEQWWRELVEEALRTNRAGTWKQLVCWLLNIYSLSANHLSRVPTEALDGMRRWLYVRHLPRLMPDHYVGLVAEDAFNVGDFEKEIWLGAFKRPTSDRILDQRRQWLRQHRSSPVPEDDLKVQLEAVWQVREDPLDRLRWLTGVLPLERHLALQLLVECLRRGVVSPAFWEQLAQLWPGLYHYTDWLRRDPDADYRTRFCPAANAGSAGGRQVSTER